MKTKWVFIDVRMDKVVVNIHNGILFSHKKWRNPAVGNSMDETWGHYANGVSQAQKDKHCGISFVGGIWKKSNLAEICCCQRQRI